jgi:hypothetical protein
MTMSMKDRYTTAPHGEPRWGAIARDGILLLAAVIILSKAWPFYSVPTGSRGVVTQFGKIVGIEQEQLRLAAENKLRTVEAEQKQKVAIAQAEALRVQNSALAQSKEVLELRRIEVEQTKANRWNGQLPQNVYAGTPIPFLNVSKQ